MKLVYAFFTGLVLGGATVLVVLGETGRLAPVAVSVPERVTVAAVPPGEQTHVIGEPVENAGEPEPKAPPSSSRAEVPTADTDVRGLMIPVLGVAPESLRDTYDQARGGGARRHEALDIMAPRGSEVVAAADGTIRKLFLSRAGGITIYQEGVRGEMMYYYAHLERYASGIREGTRVSRGDVIGYVGSSGNASADAPHLHFAIFRLPPSREWWKGEPINPYPQLSR